FHVTGVQTCALPISPLLPRGTAVGHWKIDGLLGRGGMGEVYMAHRVGADFEQRAALKLLIRMQSDEDRAMFIAERRILARLEHRSEERRVEKAWGAR